MPQNPVLAGLKQAGTQPPAPSIDALIAQRQGINQAVSGQPPALPQSMEDWAVKDAADYGSGIREPQGWHPPMMHGRIPEPWGGPLDGLQGAGPTPTQTPMDFDALMKRAQALEPR